MHTSSMKIEFLQQGQWKVISTLRKFSSVNKMAIPFTHQIYLALLTFVQTRKKSTATNMSILKHI